MKLYDSKLSPYANRVRLQLYLKGIDAQLIDVPSGGSHTADYVKINPLEKIPTLEDNGFFIPESSVIGEYIEDTRPTPSLRSADPKERVRMRVMYNIADQYILNPLFELFDQVNPKTRDAKIVDEQLTALATGLKGLDHFIAPGKYAMGAQASLADCALVPSLFFAAGLGPMLGQGDLLAATPKVKAYWTAVQTDPSVAKVIGEMTAALTEYLSRPQ
jgi:glutathione S-transferase